VNPGYAYGLVLLGSFLLTAASPVERALGAEVEESQPDCGGSILRDGRYHNIGDVDITPRSGHGSLFYRFFFEDRKDQEPKSALPVEKRKAEDYAAPPGQKTRITWLGHSAMLIEIGGLRILTDPNLGQRASPLSWAGPKRFTPPPISAEDLPGLDAVLISHDHYDHLDYKTIMALKEKTARFVAPMGVGGRMVDWGVEKEKVTQLDWWEEYSLEGKVTLALAPAQHFSARGLLDRNKTLWGSWVITTPESRVYFSGDTGMFGCFKEIGRRYGPFDFTLMHIGAYADVWPEAHMTPEQAIQAHVDLDGGVFIPMHWGTFRMAFHPWKEPAERFYNEAIRRNISFATPLAGVIVENPHALPRDPWWRELE